MAREGYDLLGWFTEPEGGRQLTPADAPQDGDVYYAHWAEAAPPVLIPRVDPPALTGDGVTVTVTCGDETAWVWCAVYDGTGRMLAAEKKPVTPGEGVSYAFDLLRKVRGASRAGIFLLSADGTPLCRSGKTG